MAPALAKSVAPVVPPALKGLALGMDAAAVQARFAEAECGERLCVITLPEGFTLAQQPASRAMVGLYQGHAVAISFELPQGAWDDLCRALRQHPTYATWRFVNDEDAGACQMAARGHRWRLEVSSSDDGSVVRATLLDVKGFNANQLELDRARAADL